MRRRLSNSRSTPLIQLPTTRMSILARIITSASRIQSESQSTITFMINRFAIGSTKNRVCLEQKYTKKSCPLYLTKEGFELLKADDGAKMNAFRLHTDSIINVIKQLGPNSLTVTVLMDHMDWYAIFYST